MANTTNSKASSKHRAKKKKITIRNQSNLAHAKKKTLEELHALCTIQTRCSEDIR